MEKQNEPKLVKIYEHMSIRSFKKPTFDINDEEEMKKQYEAFLAAGKKQSENGEPENV